MEGVEIIRLSSPKKDERGKVFEFMTNKFEKGMLVITKAGNTRAACYHTGKNPKIFPKNTFVLNGKVKATFKNLKTKEQLTEIIDEPTIYKIEPYVYHEFESITDSIIIDMNSIADLANDRIKGDILLD